MPIHPPAPPIIAGQLFNFKPTATLSGIPWVSIAASDEPCTSWIQPRS
mgnify:CR=1 FL=1